MKTNPIFARMVADHDQLKATCVEMLIAAMQDDEGCEFMDQLRASMLLLGEEAESKGDVLHAAFAMFGYMGMLCTVEQVIRMISEKRTESAT